jgi:integrase
MGRRGNGEGTITRRKDGRWEARYCVPTVNGTKRKTIYGKTQA